MIEYLGSTIFDNGLELVKEMMSKMEKQLRLSYSEDELNELSVKDKFILWSLMKSITTTHIKKVVVFNSCELYENNNVKNYIKFTVVDYDGGIEYYETDSVVVTGTGFYDIDLLLKEYYDDVDFVEDLKEYDFIKNMSSHVLVGSLYNCKLKANEFFEICRQTHEKLVNAKLISIYDTDKDETIIKESHFEQCVMEVNETRNVMDVSVGENIFYIYYNM